MTDSKEKLARAYNYLGRIRALERLILRKTLQRDELQSCLLPRAIKYDIDKVQSSPGDALLEVAAAVIDLDKEIEKLVCEKAMLIRDISQAIDLLDDDMEKLVLTAYYICRNPIRKIADEVHYSRSQTYNYYRAGLIHLSERLDKLDTHI